MSGRTDKTGEVSRRVLRMVLEGRYAPGDRIPPEREMAREAGMSRITVRRAYAGLEAAGVLVRRQGRGTSIAKAVRGCSDEIRHVGLLTSSMSPFAAAFLSALERGVSATGALLVVRTSGESTHGEEAAAIDLVAKGVRNLVIWPGGLRYRRETFDRLRAVGTNMVFFDRVRPGPIADFVGLDNRDAVDRLLERASADGCSVFHLVGHGGNAADSEQERVDAFLRWCARRGARHACWEVPWDRRTAAALRAARGGGLGRGPRVGILCTHDLLALRVAGVLGGRPRLYSINGYPEAVAAGITTIEQPLAKMARLALRLLGEQRAGGASWQAREVRCRGRLIGGGAD